MKIESLEVQALIRQVSAATEEFEQALAYHEAWKPTAYDEDLHRRIGTSYAANTFRTIRVALRREMLLALMRMWDSNSKSVRLQSIACALRDQRIIEVFADRCASHWGGNTTRVYGQADTSDEMNDAIQEAMHKSESAFGQQQADCLRQNASNVVALIDSYGDAHSKHERLEQIRRLRNERLAHRQVKGESGKVDPAVPDDELIEEFFQDTLKAVQLLRSVVEDVSYDPQATAEIRRRHAALFWEGVKGERTEGHPKFRPPPILETE